MIDFRRQNLTSTDVRFWRLKSVPALRGLIRFARSVSHTRISSTMFSNLSKYCVFQMAYMCGYWLLGLWPHADIARLDKMKWMGFLATFVHIWAKLGHDNLLRMVGWMRWHCPLDTGFEIRALAVWGRARYPSVTEASHCIESARPNTIQKTKRP